MTYNPEGECGVFLTASLFNHDCLPNCRFKWNSNLRKMTVHALRDIEPGEELTTTYINLGTYDERQKWLQEKFHFTCSCEACTVPENIRKEIDADIREIKVIDESLKSAIEDIDKSTTEPLEVSLRFAYRQRHLLESNLLDRAAELNTYELVAHLTAEHGDFVRAKLFSERHLYIHRDMGDHLDDLLDHHYGPAVPYHFPALQLEDWLWMQHLPAVEVSEEESSEEGQVWIEDEDGGRHAFDVETLD
ncbi:hypothetical protein PG993_014946 [Apiospora rasikravindrae]|uniref:SET domain-containing protein n=1 Tax=Apiospora rasikravindrae TaxID=990691 RepID=A0ABR1RPE9_9PEZI